MVYYAIDEYVDICTITRWHTCNFHLSLWEKNQIISFRFSWSNICIPLYYCIRIMHSNSIVLENISFVCSNTKASSQTNAWIYKKNLESMQKKDKRSYADCVRERIIFPLCFHIYSFFFAILTSYFCCTTTISLPYVVY